MPVAEFLTDALTEVGSALSVRSALGTSESHTAPLARRWLLRVGLAGALISLASFGVAVVLGPAGDGAAEAAIVGYAGLTLALMGALGWASLFSASRRPGVGRGRDA
jgi:hypothetical protein